MANESTITVVIGANNLENGVNLLAAYAAAKLLTPGGNPLAADNRATVILPAGHTYELVPQDAAPAMELDTDFVDLAAEDNTHIATTIITSAGGEGKGSTVTQTAGDVQLHGYTTHSAGEYYGNHSFEIGPSVANDASHYGWLHFRHDHPETIYHVGERCPVWGSSPIGGTWHDCEADAYAWRCDDTFALTATMDRCTAGDDSFGGDEDGVDISGTLRHCTGGNRSFGGCDVWGCDISGTLEDCVAGDNAYALGMIFSGIARRCHGGANCFAGHNAGPDYGTFAGYAENCVASGNSFGAGGGTTAGVMRNCTITAMGDMVVDGAEIRGCRLDGKIGGGTFAVGKPLGLTGTTTLTETGSPLVVTDLTIENYGKTTLNNTGGNGVTNEGTLTIKQMRHDATLTIIGEGWGNVVEDESQCYGPAMKPTPAALLAGLMQ